jgi:hypothetical protein
MITRQTTKQSSLALVAAVALMTVACGANSPLAPGAVSRSSASLADAASTAGPSETVAIRQALFPPIDPPNISCPSDAPQIRVGSFGSRLDIDFSAIKGTIAYEIEIRNSAGDVAALLNVDAPANHAEWSGPNGAYLVRVRSRNCGGYGKWSESAFHQIHGGAVIDEGCNLKREFEVIQDDFTFLPSTELQSADLTVRFNNGGGIWGLALFTSNDDLGSDTEAERSTSGTFLSFDIDHVACGGSALGTVHQGNHAWPYWWFRVYLDGVLLYTSDRYSL